MVDSPDMLEFTAQQLGMPTQCYTRWDGRTDCIWGFPPDGVGDFTISTWFRAGPTFGSGLQMDANSEPGITWANLFAKGQLGMTHPGVVVTLYRNDRVIFRLQQLPAYSLNVSCSACVSSSQWVFFAFVRRHDTLKVFQDGVLLGAQVVPSFDVRNIGTMRIGADHVFSAGLNMNAWVDDFRMYDYALSDAGVRRQYGLTVSLDCAAVYPPLHGLLGTCNASGFLANMATCTFICDSGYLPEGLQPRCILGTTVSTVSCEPLQQKACTDSRATNFDSSAGVDDGSCVYSCTQLAAQLGLNTTLAVCKMAQELNASDWNVALEIVESSQISLLQGLSSVSQRNGRLQVNGGQLAMRHVAISNMANSFGGAVESQAGAVAVERCIFASNSAGLDVDVPYAGSGGAIYAHNGGGQVTVEHSRFTDNTAAVQGGAIMLDSGVQCIITGSVFRGNVALRGGGAIWTAEGHAYIEACVFERNEAREGGRRRQVQESIPLAQMGLSEGKGGAIFALLTPITIISTMFTANSATLEGGALWARSTSCTIERTTFHTDSAHIGGSIYAADTLLTLTNDLMNSSVAMSGRGHAIYMQSLRPGWRIFNSSVFPFDPSNTVYSTRTPQSGCAEYPCDPGFSCSDMNVSTFCTRCPERLMSTDGITCRLCGPGLYARANGTGCDPCQNGMYSRYGVCERCPKGAEVNVNRTKCLTW